MTQAIVHIGLHKTGTTSFQIGCAQSVQSLEENGIFYPLDDQSTLRSNQHQGIVHRLTSGEDPISEARRIFRLSEGKKKILLSAEDFSNFFGIDGSREAALSFIGEMNKLFSKVEYFCVIREDRQIVTSTLREMIDLSGIPRNGKQWVQKEIVKFYERNVAINEILGKQLKVLIYEDIMPGNLTKNLLRICTGVELEMPDTFAHVSSKKDFRYILMSNVRRLLFHGLKAETPYTKEVNEAYAKAFTSIAIEEEMERTLSSMFNAWLSAEVESALINMDCTLKGIYGVTPRLQTAS